MLTQETDGCFFFVGSGFKGEEVLPHHKSCFDFDERAVLVGASIFLHIVDDAISRSL